MRLWLPALGLLGALVLQPGAAQAETRASASAGLQPAADSPFQQAVLKLDQNGSPAVTQTVAYRAPYRWHRGRWWYPRRGGGWYYWSGGRWVVYRVPYRPYYSHPYAYGYSSYYPYYYRRAPRYGYYPYRYPQRYYGYGYRSRYPYYYGRRGGVSIGIGF